MDIELLERQCQGCGAKLTEFEIREKESYCIECYEEKKKE